MPRIASKLLTVAKRASRDPSLHTVRAFTDSNRSRDELHARAGCHFQRKPSLLHRFLDLTIVRIVIALFSTALAGGLVAQFASDHTSGSLHNGWPSLCGAVAALLAYALYVRLIERRRASELAFRGAWLEVGLGLAGGAALVALVVGSLAVLGAYHFESVNWGIGNLAVAFSQMVFVGVFEELLTRAILFRLIERSLGSWPALAISSVLFGLAHMPGNSMTPLAISITIVAGGFLGAAYLATRRVWLCMALHVAWNFTLGSIFSISVSGHERTPGLIAGSLSGPQWLTGGSYGLEGSVLTPVFMLAAGAWLAARAVSRERVVTWGARRSSLASA